jgi:hypothetical protein
LNTLNKLSLGGDAIVKMARDEDTSIPEFIIAGGLGALLGRKVVQGIAKTRGKHLSKKGLGGKIKRIAEGPRSKVMAGVVGAGGGLYAKKKLDQSSEEGRQNPAKLLNAIREHRRGHK